MSTVIHQDASPWLYSTDDLRHIVELLALASLKSAGKEHDIYSAQLAGRLRRMLDACKVDSVICITSFGDWGAQYFTDMVHRSVVTHEPDDPTEYYAMLRDVQLGLGVNHGDKLVG